MIGPGKVGPAEMLVYLLVAVLLLVQAAQDTAGTIAAAVWPG